MWHSALPKKLSVVMWNAIHECLPLDDRIRRVGIPIVSRCDCCFVHEYEDLDHVLTSGEFVEAI